MDRVRLHQWLAAFARRQFALFSVRRHWPVLLVLCAGVLLSAGAYVWARRMESNDIRFIFEREAQTEMNAVQNLIETNLSKTRVVAEFVRKASDPFEHDFRMTAGAMLSRETGVVALEWVPRVMREALPEFVEAMRRRAGPGFAVRQMEPDGRLVPAEDRPTYFPIAIVEPPDDSGEVMGLDLGVRPGAAEALADATRSGGTRLSAPTRLLQSGAGSDGVLAFVPVYRGQGDDPLTGRIGPLRGFVVGVYRMGEILQQAVRPFEEPTIPVQHSLYVLRSPGEYRLIFAQEGFVAPPTLTDAAIRRLQQDGRWLSEAFDIHGQRWLGVSQTAPEAIADLRTRTPPAILITGLLLTWILAAYFWLLINRAAEVAKTVEERTRALALVNDDLRRENAGRLAAEREISQALASERAAHELAVQAREQLEISEARYRVMGETLPYGVWLADARGEPQYFSQSFLDLLQMTLEETRDLGWTRRLASEEAARAIQVMREALDTGRIWENEHRFLGPDRQYHTVLLRGLPVRDASGRITSWVGINLDISQRKVAEEELRQHRDYLEELVRSRTLELMITNEELRRDIERSQQVEQALRTLQENLEDEVKVRTAELAAANRELEAFSYSVSHDLRAPLRHIVGFVQLLHKQSANQLSPGSLRHLEIITAAATRMGKLIDDLLQFSRMGRSAMRLTSVALPPLVEDVRQELQSDLNGRHIEWLVDPELPSVQADPSLLRLVLTNLLANALKYSRTRQESRIEIGAASSDNDMATIYVRDNGVGFDRQYSDRLFGVFQRLHKAEEFEGTGIGLAIVQRIIHRHGGRVWAEGEVGCGATFYFSLPLGKEANARVEAHPVG